MRVKPIGDYVARSLQLALLLEVSAYPKPGNVHRTRDFDDTKYEHFLASSVALYPCFKEAAEKGARYARGEIGITSIGVGELIKDSVDEMLKWQRGGNTHLGAILLLIPFAVGAGMSLAEGGFSVESLRRHVSLVVKRTTPRDAVLVYDAILKAKPGGLGEAPELDVTDEDSKREILERGVTLFEVFRIASPYDSIAREWVTGYSVTFEIGYPYLAELVGRGVDINTAIVNTFLKILSEVPDTLIARKAGLERAREVSLRAKRVLDLGGLMTEQGRRALEELDEYLRDPQHSLNPGTTADLTASSIAVLILSGYRP